MCVPLAFRIKLLITLVALILVTSWKVDVFHMAECVLPPITDLPTQTALKLSYVFSFSEFLGVCMQVNFNTISIFPSVLHFVKVMSRTPTVLPSMILHLQCSQFKYCILQGLS